MDSSRKFMYHRSMDEMRTKIAELMGKGWTRQAIADELEVHRTSIHEWEVGKQIQHIPSWS